MCHSEGGDANASPLHCALLRRRASDLTAPNALVQFRVGQEGASLPQWKAPSLQEQYLLEGNNNQELAHTYFAKTLSTLPAEQQQDFASRGFQIDDPSSELFLRHALVADDAKAIATEQAVCVDIYSDNELLKIEPTAAARKAKMIMQIDRAHGENPDGAVTPYERSVINERNIKCFRDNGVHALEDAECCTYALSFYTGGGSNGTSRAGSLAVRKGNLKVANAEAMESYLGRYSHIIYFLTMALRSLPYLWGTVVRYVTMSAEAASIYVAGSIVTWMQFSSTKRGDGPLHTFSGRNCKFVIHSIKGRHIAQFSNYGEEEDEVLFTPFTRMLVVSVEQHIGGFEYLIHLREVELGLTNGLPLLWVDDRILSCVHTRAHRVSPDHDQLIPNCRPKCCPSCCPSCWPNC